MCSVKEIMFCNFASTAKPKMHAKKPSDEDGVGKNTFQLNRC